MAGKSGQPQDVQGILEDVINKSPAVAFVWRAAEGWPVEFVSDNVGQFGYTPEDFTSGRVPYASIVHPDDLERVGAEVARYSEEGRTEFTQEYRILTRSGEVRWTDDRTWVRRDENGAITHYQGIVLDSTGRKMLEQQVQESLERRARQVQTSTDLAGEIAAAPALDELFRRVTTLIKERFGYYHVQVFRSDPESGDLVLVEGYGEAMKDAGHRVARGSGIVGQAAADKQPVLVPDASRYPGWQPGEHLPDAKGELAVPIMLGDRVLGVLDVQCEQAGQLSEEDRVLLLGLCGQIAGAMENTRLLEATQARLEQVSFLSEISAAAGSSLDLQEVLTGIAEKMARFFEVGHCGVVVREPDGERMYVAAEYPDRGAVGIEVATGGYPVADLVMQQGQILAIEDAQNDPRMGPEQEWARELDVQSALFIPLAAQDEVIGSIGLDAVGQPRRFTAEEIALAQAVAAQVGMAVQNARLFASVEAQMEERERLHGALVEAQQQAIKELSTPIIPIFDRVIAMPLIGSIDTMRVRDIMLRLLEGIDKYQAGVVILDVTGVAVIDTSVADHLNKTIQAARLKGVHTIVTGIGNEVASTIVELGIDWSGVDTLGDLQSGLVAALQRLGLKLSEYGEGG